MDTLEIFTIGIIMNEFFLKVNAQRTVEIQIIFDIMFSHKTSEYLPKANGLGQ